MFVDNTYTITGDIFRLNHFAFLKVSLSTKAQYFILYRIYQMA